MKKTIEKRSKVVVPPETKRRFKVFVVVRHTRAGDEQRHVLRVDKYKPGGARTLAFHFAEEIADEAARHYGQGSASVFKGTLTISKDAEQP